MTGSSLPHLTAVHDPDPPPSRLVANSDLSEDTNLTSLLVNLWSLSQKYGIVEHKLLVSV